MRYVKGVLCISHWGERMKREAIIPPRVWGANLYCGKIEMKIGCTLTVYFIVNKTCEQDFIRKTAVEKCSDDSISINNVIKKHDKNILAIALANLLHWEVIEDAHSKYNISQKDMCEMNRCAVNRARCFLEFFEMEKNH